MHIVFLYLHLFIRQVTNLEFQDRCKHTLQVGASLPSCLISFCENWAWPGASVDSTAINELDLLAVLSQSDAERAVDANRRSLNAMMQTVKVAIDKSICKPVSVVYTTIEAACLKTFVFNVDFGNHHPHIE